jgi:hypothetical protein
MLVPFVCGPTGQNGRSDALDLTSADIGATYSSSVSAYSGAAVEFAVASDCSFDSVYGARFA